MTMEPEQITLTCDDGRRLAASFYAPEPAADQALSVQINSATAVPRRYYDAFAKHLARRGMAVLAYDYRGIGGSKEGPAQSMLHWGVQDAGAATAWLKARRPDAKLAVVGHSFGGQILGLTPHAADYAAGFFIAAQSGYWRHWPLPERPRRIFNWYVLIPLMARLLNGMPGRFLGGEALPRGVALQWARWCRTPHYLSDESGQPARPYNHLVRAPILNTSFSDDPFGPRAAVDALSPYYPQAQIERRHVAPADWGLDRIGHFGFFNRAMPLARWDEAADWLLSHALRKAQAA